jgi:hypothetical protein
VIGHYVRVKLETTSADPADRRPARSGVRPGFERRLPSRFRAELSGVVCVLDFKVHIRVPVESLRAVLEEFAKSAAQPVTEARVLTLPDGSSFALPGKSYSELSEPAKAAGMLGSTCGLMWIAVDGRPAGVAGELR